MSNYDKYKKGDCVSVTDPKHPSSPHNHAFVGEIVDVTEDIITVEDQEGNCFSVEPDEIESAI